MSLAVISDLHFGSKGFSKPIFEEQMKFIEKQFYPYLLENNIKEVFVLGDIFHNRTTIDLWIQQSTKKRFLQWFEDNKINLHLLIGNHDCYFRNTLEFNSLSEIVKGFDFVHLYDKNTIIKIQKYTIGIVPWVVDHKTMQLPKNVDILFGHFEVKDIPIMKGITSRSGIDISIFKKYKLVMSGHYHTKSQKDNFYMAGTQYQLTWNDYNEDKGFYIIDDNFGLKFIENNINPKFVKIIYNEGNLTVQGLKDQNIITNDEALEIASNQYVRFYNEKCVDQFAFDSLHNSLQTVSKNDYKIDVINLEQVVEDFDEKSFSEGIEDDTSTIKLILSFIEAMTFSEDINKDIVLKLSKEMYKEATDLAIELGDE